MTINRREVPATLERLSRVRNDLNESVDQWTPDTDPIMVSVYPVSAFKNFSNVRYQESSHVLITRCREVALGKTRIVIGEEIYTPTFVNPAGRKVQVLAKVMTPDG